MSGGATLVVGAGISGLCAAFELRRRGADATVVDAGASAGGVMRTHVAGGFTFEDGPNSIQGSADSFRALVRDLGIESDLVACSTAAARRFFVVGGRWVEVPASPPKLLFSRLLTFGEKLRVVGEGKVPPAPPRPADADPDSEESLFAFFARRFGRGPAEKYLDAVTAGVNGGDPRRLGVESAFPELVAMEREHGSVFGALKARAAARRAAGGEAAKKPPAVVTLRGGLAALVDALVRAIGPDRVRTGTRVASLRRAECGAGFDVALKGADGVSSRTFARVVLATPAAETAALVAALSPQASALFGAVSTASMAVVQTGYRAADVAACPAAFGALVPRREGLRSLGWILSSHVFPGRAPAGHVAVSTFVGGAFDPDVCAADDAALVGATREEFARTLRMAKTPEPVFARVVRWPHALPLGNVGHAGRMRAALDALRAAAPDVVVVGNAVAGAAVPKCVAFARAAVAGG